MMNDSGDRRERARESKLRLVSIIRNSGKALSRPDEKWVDEVEASITIGEKLDDPTYTSLTEMSKEHALFKIKNRK